MESGSRRNSIKIDHQLLIRKKFQIQKQVDYRDKQLKFLSMPRTPFRHASIIRDKFNLITEANQPIDNMLICKECKTVLSFQNRNYGNLLRHVNLHEKYIKSQVPHPCFARALHEQCEVTKHSKKRRCPATSKLEVSDRSKPEVAPNMLDSPTSPVVEQKATHVPIEIPWSNLVERGVNFDEHVKPKKKKQQSPRVKKFRLVMKLPPNSPNIISDWQA